MTEHDLLKLKSVHPVLSLKVSKILDVMSLAGFPMTVTDGVRTEEEQVKLYAQGRTTPGLIVTYKDGITNKSNHQIKSDGYGYAVDCAFLNNGIVSWDIKNPWHLYGELAQALGLVWGGSWKTFTDLPHIELKYDNTI